MSGPRNTSQCGAQEQQASPGQELPTGSHRVMGCTHGPRRRPQEALLQHRLRGLTTLSPMDKTLALHLSKSHNQPRGQREPFSLFKEPCFTHERDIAGSTATKVYKADPQCRALLQGSLKELLTASGDAPNTPADGRDEASHTGDHLPQQALDRMDG